MCFAFHLSFLVEENCSEEHNYNPCVAVCFSTVNCLKLMNLNSDCRAGFSICSLAGMSADQMEQDLNKIDGKTILSKSKDKLSSYQ